MLVCYFMHPCPLKISARLPHHLRGACRSSHGDWEARAQYIVPLHTLHGGYCWQRKPPGLVKFLQQRILTSTSWPLFPVVSGRSETENVQTSMAVKYTSSFRWFRVVTHPDSCAPPKSWKCRPFQRRSGGGEPPPPPDHIFVAPPLADNGTHSAELISLPLLQTHYHRHSIFLGRLGINIITSRPNIDEVM